MQGGNLSVPENPVIPFIEGDGTGPDITKAAMVVWNAAVEKVKKFLLGEMGVKKIRFPETASIGIKPVSVEGTERLVRAALEYAVQNDRKSVTLVHKGNILLACRGAAIMRRVPATAL